MIEVKACACGKLYTLEEWQLLPFAGRDPREPARMRAEWPGPVEVDDRGRRFACTHFTVHELRNCPCGSTMALEIERAAIRPYTDDEIAEREAAAEARDTIVDELEAGAA